MPKPWRENNRWRIVCPRTKRKLSFSTEQEALHALGHQTAWEWIRDYVADIRLAGRSEAHARTTRHLLQVLLPETLDVVSLDKEEATRLLRSYQSTPTRLGKRPSSVTVKSVLGHARTFWRWLDTQGVTDRNPWVGIKLAFSARGRRKPQLTLDEARKLRDKCISDDTPEAVAVLATLLLGLRASEVVNIQPRDLDDGGRILWVRAPKNGRDLALSVPMELQALMPKVAGLGGRSRYWLYYHTRRLCESASVPVVTPHGLRGTHATLARSAGATGDVVAKALNHSDERVTRDHYYQPGTVERANVISLTERLRR